jgi:prephenate dehydrogenase
MDVTLLGLGLIGGSIAKALAAARSRGQNVRISAWSPSGDGPRSAFSDGTLDRVASDPSDAIAEADLVVLAGPPLSLVATLAGFGPGGPLEGALGSDTTLTDVASTKRVAVAAAEDAGLRFVGGHPMAGRETSGWTASDAELFVGRPWVVTPAAGSTAADVQRVEWLASVCGARPVRMTAAEHDAVVAAISHAPLVVAVALVEAVAGVGEAGVSEDWPAAARLAATGWRDMTRLARGDPTMAAGIVVTNATEVVRRLRDVRDRLDDWLLALDGSPGEQIDVELLERRFGAARRRLTAADGLEKGAS